MRGIILAGGTGSRLAPLTNAINKHVLPVGGVPMIYHSLRVMQFNHIADVTIVSTPRGVGQIAEVVGDGSRWNCKVDYRVQEKPGGIPSAILAAERRTGPEDCAVILGDNIFDPAVTLMHRNCCYLKKIEDQRLLRQFGVASFGPGNKFRIIEKPQGPVPSEFAVVGLYTFTASVWQKLHDLRPSERGETEITDLLNQYAEYGQLEGFTIVYSWGDAGTPEGFAECNKFARST